MRRLAVAALSLLAVSCAPSGPVRTPPAYGPAPSAPASADRLQLLPADFSTLPGWRDDTAATVLPAFLRSCNRLLKLPPDRSVGHDGMGGTAADWYTPCSAAGRLSVNDHETARLFFESLFQPFLVTNNGAPQGTFTGYFEPELPGSRVRQGVYTIPIHGKPSDMVVRERGGGAEPQVGRMVDGQFTPYPSRSEIESGALNGRAPVLAWVADPVDAHILHIQGSGRIRMDDGTVLRLGVAATNGQKFVGIGKVMRDRALIEDVSMPSIRAWLKAHPVEAREIMAQNPRYVFYRVNDGEGPLGSEGVALTPERSLAVDTRFIPLGMPLWLETNEPSGRPLRRLMVAQDTGTAIKGPVRGDFFWGAGEEAFDKAGRMKSPGRYWLLLPRQRSPRIASAQ